MKPKAGIKIFALIEIIIGAATFVSVTLTVIQSMSVKPFEVIIFVLTTSLISFILGLGILKQSALSYYFLLYFSSIIILSKILIFAKIISLSGELETRIPSAFKNFVSIAYHGLLIYYFTRDSIKKAFFTKNKS